MKKRFLICLLCLLTASMSFSQSILSPIQKDSLILITPRQLQITNLIFIEHEKLLSIDSLYKKQIADYQKVLATYSEIDSIQQNRVDSCLVKIQAYNKQLQKLSKENSKISKWSKIKNWIIGGLGVGLLISFLVK